MINANKPAITPIPQQQQQQQQQQQRRPFTEQQQNEQILIASRHQQVATLPTPILMNERTNEIHGLGSRAASAMPNQTDIVLSSQMARQLTGLDGQAFVPPGCNK